jgi:hypothetical protein
MEPSEEERNEDEMLDQFRDDDEHTAAWKLFSDVDDRIESMYEGGDLVNVTVRSRRSLTDFGLSAILEGC